MTAAATAPRWDHLVRRTDEPLDPDRLRWVLNKVQRWQPYVDGDLLEDLAFVLDDYAPAEDEVEDIARRLHGHLARLVNLAVTSQAAHQDREVAALVTAGLALRGEALPEHYWQAVGHVRRTGWTLNELLERLVANQCLKATA